MRVYANKKDELVLAEGDYGIDPRNGFWYCRPPGCHMGCLKNHKVVEHEDGSITVDPSILVSYETSKGKVEWHGYLERGIWRKVN